MTRSASTPRGNLETLERPEGGAGGTGPPVVPPAVPAQARRDVVATLHQLIDTLTELSESPGRSNAASLPSNLPLLLTAVEAGKLLSISRSKVLDLATRGHLPSLRIGGSVRIPREALVEWIADRTNGVQTGGVTREPEWARVDRDPDR